MIAAATSLVAFTTIGRQKGGGVQNHGTEAELLEECDVFRVAGRVTVAGGTGKPMLRAFPSMVNLGNGELLAGYGISRDHHATPGMGFMTTRSRDGGRTWSEALPLLALPGFHAFGCQGLMKCPDGSLLCSLARAYYPGWRQYRRVNFEKRGLPAMEPFPCDAWRDRRLQRASLVRSFDKGNSWTPVNWDEPFEAFPGRFTSCHTTGEHGPHELSDGRWMLGVEGMTIENHMLGGVVYSEDRGVSWSPVQIIHDYPNVHAPEQKVVKLGGTRYLSYTRCDPKDILHGGWRYEENCVRFSLSEDDGRTWSEPWRSDFLGSGGPEMVRLRDGGFLCLYRDMDDSRPGLGVSHSSDECRTWRYLGRLCGRSAQDPWGWHGELGYPVAARLPDGLIFVVYYGPATADGNADVVGVYLEDRTG